MPKKNSEKQILFLTMLLTASVAINISMVILIHLNNNESPASAIVKTFTGNTPFEMITNQVIQQTEITREPIPEEEITPTPIDEEEIPIQEPEEEPTTPYEELLKIVIVDEDVMPVPYAYYDYDRDGNIDLVRKEVDGDYYVYKNKGTTEDKIFKEGTKLNNLEGNQVIENYAAKSTSSVTTPAETQVWLPFSHPRYDLYIDEAYYNSNGNGPLLDDFFNEFDERFALLESTTDWSSEENSVYGTKLRINVTATAGCSGGSAYLGYANIKLSNPLYMSGCEMAYFENGIPHFSNPGELGDWWFYMGTAIHESLHGINPDSVIIRPWLTEGFSQYQQYGILSNYNGNGFLDINQETADTYIYQGTTAHNWPAYVTNDYHDTTPQNNEIQSSAGYSITAWMFSMMRDNHSLNWSDFYNLIENNQEISDKATQLYLQTSTTLPSDMYLIDLFGRASNLTFNQTKAIWEYDGPSGPGWGVRNWELLDWYADLTPTNISFSKTNPVSGETITATANISNNGGVSLNQVSVRFYATNTSGSTVLVNEQFVNFSFQSSKQVNVSINSSLLNPKYGVYKITVKVDEPNIKIETNELNNNYSRNITFYTPSGGSGCGYDKRNRRYYACA
jgi:hypothetical protein